MKKQHKILALVLALFYFFNLVDTFLTFFLVKHNLATEVNALVAFLLEKDPFYFFFAKFFVSTFFIYMMWKNRGRKVTLYSSFLVCSVYSLLFLYQVYLVFYIIFTIF